MYSARSFSSSHLIFPSLLFPLLLVYTTSCSFFIGRVSAGGSAASGFFAKLFVNLSVGRSLGKLTPRQLGEEDAIDEDVQTEMDRVAAGGANNDVVKVID